MLVGAEVPQGDGVALREFLTPVGYVYHDETDNAAYRLFLGNPS